MKGQQAFAEVSGDHNPLHLDPLAARRLITGAPVAHGMHLVLWSLEKFFEKNAIRGRISELKGRFLNPVEVGTTVTFEAGDPVENGLTLTVCRENGQPLVQVECLFSEHVLDDRSPVKLPTEVKAPSIRELEIKNVAGISGKLDLNYNPAEVSKMFPVLARTLAPGYLADLLALTRLVGTQCPGRHSLFAEFNLSFIPTGMDAPELAYKVDDVDPRFSLISMSIETPHSRGRVKAFFRPPPVSQLSVEEIAKVVKKTEFKNEKVLIIGGSRGLGEVTAKIFAAGGAEVAFTYFQGEEDGKRVRGELEGWARAVFCFPFDVTAPPSGIADSLLVMSAIPSALYYFATPHISGKTGMAFSPEKFDKFCEYYVTGLFNTVQGVRNFGVGPLAIINPSSIFVEEIPDGMGEYAAAKASSESLCRYLETILANTKFYCPRLPRLETDQTASLMSQTTGDILQTMLEVIRGEKTADKKG